MSGGFGRKGVVSGQAPATVSFGQPRTATMAAPADDLSPAARAFLAAERARSAEDKHRPEPSAAAASAAASATKYAPSKGGTDRSLVIAYVFWWFAGPLAAHRFYLGAYKSAWAMIGLFWGGLVIAGVMSKQSSLWIGGLAVPPPGIAMILVCMVWILIDAFLIPGLRRKWQAEHLRPA